MSRSICLLFFVLLNRGLSGLTRMEDVPKKGSLKCSEKIYSMVKTEVDGVSKWIRIASMLFLSFVQEKAITSETTTVYHISVLLSQLPKKRTSSSPNYSSSNKSIK